MPDLVTHVSVAYFLSRALRISKYTTIFFAGTILPDIVTRPFYVLLPDAYWFVYPLHTPLVMFSVCLLISYVFEATIRKKIFMALLTGVLLHFVLDLFQKHLNGVNYWLFPFTDLNIEIGLFWQDDSVYAVPFLLTAVIIMEIGSFLKRRPKSRQAS